jgi:nucleotide-binding universal stress UspA family protein
VDLLAASDPNMLKKIFCAIDDQEHSGRAADTAIEIARTMSSAVIFFMANPAVLPGRGPAVYRWTKDYINGYFSEARARARRSGVFDTKCITRNASDITNAILLEAENANADFIVVGSNSRPGAFGNWKRSITREVAARAPCPTIIVHEEPQEQTVMARLLAAE